MAIPAHLQPEMNQHWDNVTESITGTNPLAGTSYVQGIDPNVSAIDQLRDLAFTNPAYMETYLQLLAERENTTNAMAWYEKMSGSQYQRAVEDLKKAGLNPYLALQSLGGAGSGSVSPAGTWSTSPYANKVAQDKMKVDQSKLGISIAGVVTSVMAMIAMLMA